MRSISIRVHDLDVGAFRCTGDMRALMPDRRTTAVLISYFRRLL